jgi:hypothetical protein
MRLIDTIINVLVLLSSRRFLLFIIFENMKGLIIRTNKRANERANERTSERMSERTSERTNKVTNERASERAKDCEFQSRSCVYSISLSLVIVVDCYRCTILYLSPTCR